MRFRASTAGGLGLTLLCGSFLFSGCASDSGSARNGATGSGGSAGAPTTTAGTAGTATAGSAGSTAVAGTGGGGGSGGSVSVTPVCPTPMAVEGNVISEFEGSTPTFGAAGEFAGGYYAYSDLEKGGTTTPTTATPGTELMPVTGSHEGNGLHYAGTGFAADSWGAGFGVWMTCADASTVDGVAFWVKNDQPLRVAATIPGTQSASSGGECTVVGCTPNSFTVEPHAEWTLVEIPWASFTGGTVPFTPAKLMGIDILVPKPEPEAGVWGFDVSLDNLHWLGGTPVDVGAGGGGSDVGAGGAPEAAGGAG